jgi:hypothetical protein
MRRAAHQDGLRMLLPQSCLSPAAAVGRDTPLDSGSVPTGSSRPRPAARPLLFATGKLALISESLRSLVAWLIKA